MAEKCNIKWRDFQPHITNTFMSLKNDKKFADVTLMSDDYIEVTAHKVVLSAGSAYFNKVLSKRNHSHPLLCIDSVSGEEARQAA